MHVDMHVYMHVDMHVLNHWLSCRERESAAARRYSVTSNYKHPQVVVLIKGVESNLVSFEVGAGDLEEEAHHIAELLLQSIEREEEKVETADGGVSPISIADLMGVDMFVNRSHTNLVVAFCKKGEVWLLSCDVTCDM